MENSFPSSTTKTPARIRVQFRYRLSVFPQTEGHNRILSFRVDDIFRKKRIAFPRYNFILNNQQNICNTRVRVIIT